MSFLLMSECLSTTEIPSYGLSDVLIAETRPLFIK